ncbi:unnamed protein product, partial [Sphenostylis stenocarpa]
MVAVDPSICDEFGWMDGWEETQSTVQYAIVSKGGSVCNTNFGDDIFFMAVNDACFFIVCPARVVPPEILGRTALSSSLPTRMVLFEVFWFVLLMHTRLLSRNRQLPLRLAKALIHLTTAFLPTAHSQMWANTKYMLNNSLITPCGPREALYSLTRAL